MYCKHCGKEIADDSKYCQYCGGSQGQESKSSSNGLFASFAIHKKGWILYLIWVSVNYIVYLIGNKEYHNIWWGKDDHPQDTIFPFPKYSYDWFDIDSYDFSEFIIYSFIIPLIIYFCVKYKKDIKKLFKKKMGNSEMIRKE